MKRLRTWLFLVGMAALCGATSGCFNPFAMGLATPIPMQPWVADRIEERFGDFKMLGGGVSALAYAGHAGSDDRAGVGHGADDGNLFAQALFDIAGGNGGSDGNDEGVLIQLWLDLF